MTALSPKYITWLTHETTTLWPTVIREGQLADFLFRQNITLVTKDEEELEYQKWQMERFSRLYGPLRREAKYQAVNRDVWVRDYREIHKFEGTDERLLGLMGDAFEKVLAELWRKDKDGEYPPGYNGGCAASGTTEKTCAGAESSRWTYDRIEEGAYGDFDVMKTDEDGDGDWDIDGEELAGEQWGEHGYGGWD